MQARFTGTESRARPCGVLIVAIWLIVGCGASAGPGDAGIGQLVPDASADVVSASLDVVPNPSPDMAPSSTGDDGWLAYQPTSVGSTWTLQVTQGQGVMPSSDTTTVTESSPTGYTLKTGLGDGGWRLNVYQVTDQGMLSTATTTYGSDGTVLSGLTFSPPEMILPSRLAAGFAASTTSTQTVQSMTSQSTTIVTRELTVTGPEQVTVPARTFTAMKVTTLITSIGSPGTAPLKIYNVRWWAKGVGCVKTVNHPESDPTPTSTFELTSYSIP
jgi:hypothetical protein